ncbi:UDP-glycosyltransferase UGT5-like [Anabrus simplex]|uniref:UDP-glycosyltransferase UGT5-like n=1 Tax=Anabrus simplex TaxID=316456 RepID=UPI0035A28D04
MVTTSSSAVLLILIVLTGEWNNKAVGAARILALLSVPSRSHHIWNRSLMLALAARGHQVTVVSPDPEKQSVANLREIILEDMYDDMHEAYDYEAMSQEGYFQNTITIFDWGYDACKSALASKGAKRLKDLTVNETFDLIIVEAAIDDCFLSFIPEFGSPPVMAMVAYSSPPWAGFRMGNPDNPSYVNTFNLPYSDHMDFFQRMVNMILHSFVLLSRAFYHMPAQQKIAEDFFGKSLPPIVDVEKNLSLILVNIHYSMDYPRPMVPALIPVAGMHIKPSKPLPQDLQKYLDDAKEGVIYFSLGSNVRSDKLTAEKRQMILEAFSELPHKVLWKWESDTLPGQPKNVKVGKWLPQNDILGHPNVKLFITHSGLLSTQEAIYHGVPVVGMPFLADQFVNIRKSIARGVGEMVDYNTLTKDSFLATVRKVLYTPSYTIKMKRLSELFRDRPETPLETAVYWTEYVIKHNGAHHLRSAALDLAWYQYFLLDVISVLTIGIILCLMLLYFVAKIIYKVVTKTKKNVKTKKH